MTTELDTSALVAFVALIGGFIAYLGAFVLLQSTRYRPPTTTGQVDEVLHRAPKKMVRSIPRASRSRQQWAEASPY